MKHFGVGGFHPRPFAGRENDGVEIHEDRSLWTLVLWQVQKLKPNAQSLTR
jgi:hypothetical protein